MTDKTLDFHIDYAHTEHATTQARVVVRNGRAPGFACRANRREGAHGTYYEVMMQRVSPAGRRYASFDSLTEAVNHMIAYATRILVKGGYAAERRGF